VGNSSVSAGSPLRAADLLSQVHDAINATDANGILHTWNAGSERIYGYSAEDAIGQHVSMLFFPEDLPFLERDIFAAISGTDTLERTVRNRRKDGMEVFVALRLSVLRDTQGAIQHIIGCSNDITERARAEFSLKQEIAGRENAEAALHLNEQRLRHLLLQSRAVIFSCQAYGNYDATFVSENIESLFGYPAKDFLHISRFWVDHIHPEDRERVLSAVAGNIASGTSYVEYRFRHADGTYRWVHDNAVVIKDAEGNAVEMAGYMLDVTQEKIADEERREHEQLQYYSEALLTALEAGRKRVARELHDDLNQRLAALIVEIGLLERKPPDSPQKARETCSALKAQVAEISDHVRQIALELHSAGLEQFGLQATLKQECVSVSERSGVKIVFRGRNVPAKLPDPVALSLYRVAQEGMRNIVKHANAKSATVTLTGAAGHIRLSLEDQGAGFSPDEARNRRTLGLMSMSERIRQLGGTFTLDSKPGSGTRVEALVPLPSAE
jgi:PAS domain S-box-containing protein